MCIDIAAVRAAGKAAALVAGIQEAAKRGGDSARLAPHVERLAIIIFDQSNDAGVAGQPPGGFRGHRRPVLELAASRGPVPQRLRGHMHDDLLAIGAGRFQDIVRQEALGHQGEGVRAAGAEGNRLR